MGLAEPRTRGGEQFADRGLGMRILREQSLDLAVREQ